jgi:PAS domain-containing protein
VVLVGVAINGAAHLVSRRLDRIPVWLYVTDLAACLGFPLLYPVTFVPGAFMALAVICMAATLSGVAVAAALGLAATVGLAVAQVAIDVDGGAVAVVGFGATAFVLTEAVGRLAAEQTVLRQHLNGVIDGLDAALWVRSVDEDRITFVNQRAVAMLGWTEDQWLEPGFWSARVHPDDLETTQATLDRATALGIDTDVTYRFRTADARWLHLHDRITADVDGNGRTTSLRGLSLDVSEQFRIEQRVNQYADIVDRIDLALLVLRLEEGPDGTLIMDGANAAARSRRPSPPWPAHAFATASPGSSSGACPLRVDDLIVRPGRAEPRVVTLRAFPLTGRSVGVSLQDVTECRRRLGGAAPSGPLRRPHRAAQPPPPRRGAAPAVREEPRPASHRPADDGPRPVQGGQRRPRPPPRRPAAPRDRRPPDPSSSTMR